MLAAVGYVSAQFVPEADIDELSLGLARFAHLRGHLLCAVHVERFLNGEVAIAGYP